jgi:hypothetical protein
MLWPRGYLSNKTAFAIIFKLARKVGVASRGQNQLPKVILGISFTMASRLSDECSSHYRPTPPVTKI